MVAELERRVNELRFLDGIEKAEHVPYATGDEFWVHFSHPMDMGRLLDAVNKNGFQVVKFGALPSKLPRKLSEILWDGVTHVIVKNIGFMGLLASFLGLEPDGVAKIARDLHSGNPIFLAKSEEGIKVLYDYIGIKYVPPAPPPPKPPLPTKPAAAAARPIPAPAQRPTTPVTPSPPRPAPSPTPQAPASPGPQTGAAQGTPPAKAISQATEGRPTSPPSKPSEQISSGAIDQTKGSDKKGGDQQAAQAQG